MVKIEQVHVYIYVCNISFVFYVNSHIEKETLDNGLEINSHHTNK
jgi:hypothetical protein